MGAKKLRSLTTAIVKNAKPKAGIYRLGDGGGLNLVIRESGAKSWECRYKSLITGKYTNMGLGSYPDFSLAEARQKALEIRKLVAEGIDPKEHKQEKKREQQKEYLNTFQAVADKWIELKRKQVKEGTANDVYASLERHIFPKLGKMPISKITPLETINIMQPLVKQNKLELIKRLCQRMNEVMQYALNIGLIDRNNLSGMKAAFQKPKVTNNPSLKPEELPELLRTVATSQTKVVTKLLILWQLHTMTRSKEAALAEWDEIDLKKQRWTIPESKMKAGLEHIIPLTPQMIAILETIKPLSGHRKYIFPSDRNPLSHASLETANTALKRMGFQGRQTAHGMRSLARTTLSKQIEGNHQKFSEKAMEAALAHTEKNKIKAAYARDNYLELRIPMMHWWSDHIEKASYTNISFLDF